jgi:D-3-phosphoglycerate dehydrogenase / 2-oxoglutarate reductase
MKLVLLAAQISKEFNDYLLQNNFEIDTDFLNLEKQKNAIGIVTSTKLNIDKNFIDNAANLKWVARLGSGMEIIDCEYAASKKIKCFSSPAGIANAVAEHAIGMLLNLQKNIVKSHNEIINEKWLREANRGVELEGKTIGIIGFGHTGQAFAKKLSVFGCNVLVYDKYKTIEPQDYFTIASLQDIYSNVEIVSYHVPLNTETDNMYDANLFANKHILINTSRGKVCSTNNIIAAIENNKLVGLCLDVLDFEKKEAFNKTDFKKIAHLRQATERYKVPMIMTPHIAGYSHNAINKMSKELILQIESLV